MYLAVTQIKIIDNLTYCNYEKYLHRIQSKSDFKNFAIYAFFFLFFFFFAFDWIYCLVMQKCKSLPCCTLPTKLHKINYTIDSESIDPDPLSGHVSKNRVNKVLKSHSKQQMHTRMQNGICWCSSSASSKPGQRAGCTICNSL